MPIDYQTSIPGIDDNELEMLRQRLQQNVLNNNLQQAPDSSMKNTVMDLGAGLTDILSRGAAMPSPLDAITGIKTAQITPTNALATIQAQRSAQAQSTRQKALDDQSLLKNLEDIATTRSAKQASLSQQEQAQSDRMSNAQKDRELRQSLGELSASTRSGNEDKKRFTLLSNEIDPNRARTGNLGKAQAMVNSAERINGIFDQFPDYNIPKGQTNELAGAVAGLINGGSAQSQHQINTVTPSSLVGDANGIAGWLTNNPRGLEQQNFMRLLQDTANREGNIARGQVKAAQIQKLPAFSDLKESNPGKYNAIVRGFHITDEDIAKYGSDLQGNAQAPENKYTPDVLKYATDHNITPDQALQIKIKRGG